jgi:hypothetical protein
MPNRKGRAFPHIKGQSPYRPDSSKAETGYLKAEMTTSLIFRQKKTKFSSEA